MGTLVCFHAHPDDEAIATGGVMAKAAAAGHRVVLVTATRGEQGEVPDGYLAPGELLWERRVRELDQAASILGVNRVEFLGYTDSGMMGTSTNEDPTCFWQADVGEAAGRLARLLAEERAQALTVYDDHGVYGHPDHIQVHRVGIRAAELAGTPAVFEATMNRDDVRANVEAAAAAGGEDLSPPEDFVAGLAEMGTPASDINTVVDVEPWIAQKRQALLAHGSQVGETSMFARMPPDLFMRAFGHEWFIRRHAPSDWVGRDLLEALT